MTNPETNQEKCARTTGDSAQRASLRHQGSKKHSAPTKSTWLKTSSQIWTIVPDRTSLTRDQASTVRVTVDQGEGSVKVCSPITREIVEWHSRNEAHQARTVTSVLPRVTGGVLTERSQAAKITFTRCLLKS